MTERKKPYLARKRYTVHVCPYTHWDRAWTYPFQVFRGRLVRLMDGLLDIFDAYPDYTAFTLDGQTIPLEDYLEIRPANRKRIEAAVRNGRLAVGPFYVLPDLYLVSGEALIRNLMVGHRVASSYGHVMKAGYVPDPFGHPRTMPSIMQGFGIDSYIAMRGVPREACEKGVCFRWVAPDGTDVVFTRQVPGYGNLWQWGVRPGYPEQDPDVDVEAAMRRVEPLLRQMEEEGLNVRTVLFNNGGDHKYPQPRVPMLVRTANRRFPDLHVVQSSYEDYANALRREKPRLQTYRGELRSGYQQNVLSGVLSARMWIKQMNSACQKQLESLVEPIDAVAGVLNVAGCSPYIEHAWKALLKAHPHDDICGCSVDDVHADDATSFRHAAQMASISVQDNLRALIGRMPKAGLAGKRHVCIAFNPEPYERGQTFKMLLNAAGAGIFEERREWHVRRMDGVPVPSRVIDSHEAKKTTGRPWPLWEFFDPAMPPSGYAVYTLEPGIGVPPPAELRANGSVIENALLRAILNPDGTVDLVEKDTGRRFRGLNLLEDVEDVGDTYDYCPGGKVVHPITSRGAKGKVADAFIHLGHAEVSSSFAMRLPEAISADRSRRSKTTVTVPVTVTLRLRPGLRRLEFAVTVANTARDHRLRALFPTRVRTSSVLASSHFDIVERAVDPVAGTLRDHQSTSATQPMAEWVAVQSRGRGAAVTTKGLPEYEAVKTGDGVSLAITLLRCVGWLSRDDLATRPTGLAGSDLATPEAQCLDTYTFEYAFLPYSGGLEESGALRWAREFGVQGEVFMAHPIAHVARARGGRLPYVQSLVTVDSPALVLSALKRPEKGPGLIVRLFNPSPKKKVGVLTFCRALKSVHRVRMDETPQTSVSSFKGNRLRISLRPHEIVTLRVCIK